MNVKFNVSRFSNEDVIATSDICRDFGTLHFFTTEAGVYNPESDETTAHGESYIYVGRGRLTPQGNTLTMTIPGNVEIPVGKYFFFNGQTYEICDPQAHAR